MRRSMPLPPFGAGFRTQHFDEIAALPRAVDWFEVLSDNFVGVGGPRRAMLERLRADHPVLLHGVGLSIAGSEPLSGDYLNGLRDLAAWVDPVWVSDHLCWTAFGGHQSHDLLPIAYTEELLGRVAERVARVQDILGRRLLLENASAYVAFRDADMDEAEFFSALCWRAGCGMLLDVNNLYVNAANLGIDAARYLDSLDADTVGYMHLAGHAVVSDVRIDTHDADVGEPVWDLFDSAVRRFPAAGVIVERDDNLPSFAGLVMEVDAARARHAAAGGRGSRRESAERTSSTGVRRGSAAARQSIRGRSRWPDLQSRFWEFLVDKPVGADHRSAPDLGDLLDEKRPVAAARGMRVYSDAYALTLRRALAVNFPTLARVVTAGDFDRLAAAYIRRHPPRGHDFRSLGAELAAFVRRHDFAADYGVDVGALADLVALEQAQLEVQDEIDEPNVLPAESLGAVALEDWEEARVGFVRGVRLVRAAHEVLPAVEAVARGESPARPAPGDVAYLVYRVEGRVCTERLDVAAAAVLEGLLAGRTFGSACAAATPDGTDESSVAEEAARLLVKAAARGLVRAVETRRAG